MVGYMGNGGCTGGNSIADDMGSAKRREDKEGSYSVAVTGVHGGGALELRSPERLAGALL